MCGICYMVYICVCVLKGLCIMWYKTKDLRLVKQQTSERRRAGQRQQFCPLSGSCFTPAFLLPSSCPPPTLLLLASSLPPAFSSSSSFVPCLLLLLCVGRRVVDGCVALSHLEIVNFIITCFMHTLRSMPQNGRHPDPIVCECVCVCV